MGVKHFIFGLLALLCLPASAQKSKPAQAHCGLTLAGKILDQHQGEPLPAATIVLEELSQVLQTDMAGNYHFHNLCPGVYHLKTSYIGFEPLRQEIRLSASAIRNFKLHPVATALGTVRISGHREPATPTQAMGQLQGQALEQTRGESMGRALEQLAGVTTLNTGPSISKPVIHGLHSNRVLLLNNGVRQEGQQWGTEHAPEIDPGIASRLRVVKGAAGVRYGSDAIGGVVLVEPAPLRDSAGTDAAFNLAAMSNNGMGHAGALLNHNFRQWPALRLRLQGSLKKGGNSKAPDYYLKNTGFTEQNFSAAVGLRQKNYGLELYYSQFNSQLGILSAAHIGNLTDLQRAMASPQPMEQSGFSYRIDRPFQQVNHDLVKLSGDVRTGEAGKLSWIASYQDNTRQEYDKHLSRNKEVAARNKPEINLQLRTLLNELTWEHRPYRNFTGTMGLSAMLQQNHYQGRFFIPNYRNYTGGVFWIEKWRKDKWQLEAGTRFDTRLLEVVLYRNRVRTEPRFSYQNFSGTLGSIYELNHHWSFSLNGGSAFRSPTVNELFSNGLHHGTASVEIGDLNLKAEQAYNVVATAIYRSEQKLNAELSLYHNSIRNYIYLAPVFPASLTVRGAFPTFRYTQTNARFQGADLNLSYQFPAFFSVGAKASLVRAINQKTRDHLILIPADRLDAYLRYENRGDRTGRIRQSFLQVGGLFVNRQHRVPASPAYNPEPGTEEPERFMPVNGDYKTPPPAYFLLQASAGTTLQIGRQPVEISLAGNNLLNTAYRDYLNRFRYFADEMGRNLVLRLRLPLNF